MPLTDKGDKIMSSMKGEYGDKKGEQVFYATKNAGKIKGVDEGEGEGEGGGEKGGGEDLLKSTAGPMLAAALSDEDMAGAEERFDEVRDKIHKLDRRLDDCDAPDGALLTTPTGKKII